MDGCSSRLSDTHHSSKVLNANLWIRNGEPSELALFGITIDGTLLLSDNHYVDIMLWLNRLSIEHAIEVRVATIERVEELRIRIVVVQGDDTLLLVSTDGWHSKIVVCEVVDVTLGRLYPTIALCLDMDITSSVHLERTFIECPLVTTIVSATVV